MREVKYRLDLTHNYLKIDAGKDFYLRPNDDNTQKIFMLPQSYTINCRKLLLRETSLIPQWFLDLLYYVDDSDVRLDNEIIDEVFKFSTFDVAMDSDNVSSSGQTVFVEGVNGDAPWFSGVFERLDNVKGVLDSSQSILSHFHDDFIDYNVEVPFWGAVNSHRIQSDIYVTFANRVDTQSVGCGLFKVDVSAGRLTYALPTVYRHELVSSGNTQLNEFIYASFPRGASIYCANGFTHDVYEGGTFWSSFGSVRLASFKNLLCFYCGQTSERFLYVGDFIQFSVANNVLTVRGENLFYAVLTSSALERCRISY